MLSHSFFGLPSRNLASLRNYIISIICCRVSLADILEDCDGFKMRAFEILTPSPQVNYIGMFGDSNPLNVSQWIQLINDTSPEGFADQVLFCMFN